MTDPLPGHVLRLQVPPLHFGPQLVRLAGSSGGPGPSLHAAPRSFCANDGCAHAYRPLPVTEGFQTRKIQKTRQQTTSLQGRSVPPKFPRWKPQPQETVSGGAGRGRRVEPSGRDKQPNGHAEGEPASRSPPPRTCSWKSGTQKEAEPDPAGAQVWDFRLRTGRSALLVPWVSAVWMD